MALELGELYLCVSNPESRRYFCGDLLGPVLSGAGPRVLEEPVVGGGIVGPKPELALAAHGFRRWLPVGADFEDRIHGAARR